MNPTAKLEISTSDFTIKMFYIQEHTDLTIRRNVYRKLAELQRAYFAQSA